MPDPLSLTVMEIKVLIPNATLHLFALIQCTFYSKQVSSVLFKIEEERGTSFVFPKESHSSKESLSLFTQPYFVTMNNVRFILLCPAGFFCPQNPKAMAVPSWHNVAETSFFNYVVLRGIYYLLLRC